MGDVPVVEVDGLEGVDTLGASIGILDSRLEKIVRREGLLLGAVRLGLTPVPKSCLETLFTFSTSTFSFLSKKLPSPILLLCCRQEPEISLTHPPSIASWEENKNRIPRN